jgi:hypothetical protein
MTNFVILGSDEYFLILILDINDTSALGLKQQEFLHDFFLQDNKYSYEIIFAMLLQKTL